MTTVIPSTGQKLNYWNEHKPNTHANLKRHNTVQTVIRLIDTLTFLQSTYTLRHYIGAILIMTLI